MAAGTGAYPTGLVVLAAAHRDPPDSPRFRAWVRKHLRVSEEAAKTALWESSPWAIADVFAVEAAGCGDAALATRVLQVISEEVPEECRRGEHDFLSGVSRGFLFDPADSDSDGVRVVAEAVRRGALVDDAYEQASDPLSRELLESAMAVTDMLDDDVVLEALRQPPQGCETLIGGTEHGGFVGVWFDTIERCLRLGVDTESLWACIYTAKTQLQDPDDPYDSFRLDPSTQSASAAADLRDNPRNKTAMLLLLHKLGDCFWVLHGDPARSDGVVVWGDTLFEALRRELDHNALADAVAAARRS